MKDPAEPVRSSLTSSRGVLVAALLGFGTVVMGRELAREHVGELAGAVGVGLVLVLFLPQPRDIRSLVYAIFVPVAMAYGVVMDQLAMLLLGGAAGLFFVIEKTAARRGGSGDDQSSGDS